MQVILDHNKKTVIISGKRVNFTIGSALSKKLGYKLVVTII